MGAMQRALGAVLPELFGASADAAAAEPGVKRESYGQLPGHLPTASQAPPRQHRLGVPPEEPEDVELMGELRARVSDDGAEPGAARGMLKQDPATPDLISGPHLRGVVVVACIALWVATRYWAQQLSIVPFAMLACNSTSALWCMPQELIISLGPIPVCFLRRRIPYEDIESIEVIKGRLHILGLLLRRGVCFWQPLGCAYGLTVGKALIDVKLTAEALTGPAHGRCLRGGRVLISVDDAEEVVARVEFRKEHGAVVLLPWAMRQAPEDSAGTVRWVVCDLLEPLLAWHKRNRTTCDALGLLLQPLQDQVFGESHERTA